MGGIYWMVERQHGYSRSQHNPIGERQGLGNEQLGHGDVFPGLGYVLSDPRLFNAEAVGLDDKLYVAVVGVRVRPPGWVQWHHEESEIHGYPPVGSGFGVVAPLLNYPRASGSPVPSLCYKLVAKGLLAESILTSSWKACLRGQA